MISKLKPLPLLYLVLLLSYDVVAALKMTASVGAPSPSKELYENQRQDSRFVAPPADNDTLDYSPQTSYDGHPPIHNGSVGNQQQDLRVAEGRSFEGTDLKIMAEDVAKILKRDSTLGYQRKSSMLKIKVLSKKVFNRDSYGGAVKSFTLKVLPSLTGDEIDIRPFMKWFKKIKGHLPGNPELAYATTAVLLSEKLSKWDAARVWAKFSVEDVKSSGLLKKVLFKVWGSQKIGFEELLSTVTWNENYGLAISTFAAPAFGMMYEFMTQQTKNEMLVFNSFVDLFKARFPNGNIKSLIHEGRRVIKRKINLSQTYYLDVFVEFLTRNVIYDDASLIFHDISLLSSYDVIQTASSQLRTLLVGVTDVSRFADQLVNELFSQKKDVELFLVMHVRIFGKKYPDFKSAVFKLLSTKWVNQHDVPARTVKLFKKMQLHKAPIDANMSTRRTLRFIIWINFIYLANNYNGLGSKTICEEILRHADDIATTDVLQEAFSYAKQLLSKPIDFS